MISSDTPAKQAQRCIDYIDGIMSQLCGSRVKVLSLAEHDGVYVIDNEDGSQSMAIIGPRTMDSLRALAASN